MKSLSYLILSYLVLSGSACKPGDKGAQGLSGTPGTDGIGTLLASTAESPGSNCPTGGFLITTGSDDNQNSILDTSEIDSTQYLCNGKLGSDGSNTLISTTDGPPICGAPGGIQIDSGVDDDNSGILESGEIDSTKYICNGAVGTNGTDGTNGLNGFNALIRTGPSISCPNGGVLIQTGLDDSPADGVLDNVEVDATQDREVCNGAAGADGAAGANGLKSLISVTLIFGLGGCPDYGVFIETGVDDNDDGTLQAGEVDDFQYVCDGATGATGAPGAPGATGATGAQGPPGTQAALCEDQIISKYYSRYYEVCYDAEWVFWSHKTAYLPQSDITRYSSSLYSDGVVVDTVTKLMWERAESAALMDHAAALAYCAAQTTGGLSAGSWRLPTQTELQSLVNYAANSPAINTTAFPGTTASSFWSSTVDAINASSHAWSVPFSEGGVLSQPKTSSFRVRCVR